MQRIGRYFLGWLAAVIVTTLLACLTHSQFVIAALPAPEPVNLGDRISMSLADIAGMGPALGLFIAIGLAIAFSAGLLLRLAVTFGRPIVFITAGAVALLVMLSLMKPVFFGVQPIAGARSTAGLIAMMIMGSIGGWVFHKMTRAKSL